MMKRFLFLLMVCVASVPTLRGQGWQTQLHGPSNPPPAPPTALQEGTSTPPGGGSGGSGGGNAADAATPEITALARGLLNDPKLIYDYVRNNIRYVHYFGVKKGAALTLLEGSGNDFDQCALLVSLLREAEYSPSYGFGMQIVPYEAASGKCLKTWLGLTKPYISLQSTYDYLYWLFVNRSYPLYHDSGNDYPLLLTADGRFGFLRPWVVLNLNGTDYCLDPAFKKLTQVPGIDLTAATGSSKADVLSAAGGTTGSDWVQGLNETALGTKLTTYASSLLDKLRTQYPNASSEEILGGWRIEQTETTQFSTTTTFPLIAVTPSGPGHIPVQTWNSIPEVYFSTLRFQAGNIDRTYKFAELQGQRLSVTFASSQTKLWLDDTLQNTETGGGGGSVNITLTARFPWGDWNYSTQTLQPRTSVNFLSDTKSYSRSAPGYAIVYGFESSGALLQKRQQKLDQYKRQGLADDSREVVTETLNVVGNHWLFQTALGSRMIAAQKNFLVEEEFRVGRVSQEASYYIDVGLTLSSWYPIYGIETLQADGSHAFGTLAFFVSAMEHGVLEQLQGGTAASTVKVLQVANAASQKLFRATSANWSSIQGQLVNHNNAALADQVNAGSILLLPKDGNIFVQNWHGAGYVDARISANRATFSMFINGNYGGYAGATGNINPAAVQRTYQYSQSYFDPSGLTTPIFTGADPVNMVDGAFTLNQNDLEVGQQEPRGFSFSRYYSSNRRNINAVALGYGWTHNYNIRASAETSIEAGLGLRTPAEMAAFLTATKVALDVYSTAGTAKEWATVALIAKWGVDQLRQNAASIVMGNQTLQFIKQPNATYTSPAGITMTLTKPAGYKLQERNGRAFNFDSSSNRIATIVDQRGKTMTFNYRTDGRLSTVVDGWSPARTLTLGYDASTPPKLTSLSDGTGRTVTFTHATTYSPQGDLVSYRDPENKIWSYEYDTDHKILRTKDATTPTARTITENTYDALGRVIEQKSEGLANKKWTLYYAGVFSVEEDPQGGRKFFYYDAQGRSLGIKDANGNRSKFVYDGQDHMVQTITPKGEITAYEYNVDHNLTRITDPLLKEATRTYDTSLRLKDSVDFRSNTTSYTYTPTHELLTITAPPANDNASMPNVVTYAYNTDGTLLSQTDQDLKTTTFQYDSYGQVTRRTYHNNDYDTFSNNARGDVLTHTDALRNANPTAGNVSTFEYNLRRQLTRTTVDRVGSAPDVVTQVQYDDNGNVWKTIDAKGAETVLTYSSTQKPLSKTLPPLPNGTPVINNVYDTRDWLDTVTLAPLNFTTDYGYDPGGRTITVTDPLSQTTTYGYDDNGNRTSVRSAQVSPVQTVNYTYNARGEQTVMTDAATFPVNYTFDNNGNQTQLLNRNAGGFNSTYYKDNRLATSQTPTAKTTTRLYNKRGLISSVTEPSTQQTTFAYDDRGRLQTKTDPVGVSTYTYDQNNNLLTHVEATKTLTRVYDDLNRITSFTDGDGNVTGYEYDANGNLTRLVYPGGTKAVTYTYDSHNRLTSLTDWAGRTTTFNFDLAGRVTSIVRPNGTVRACTYDAAGQITEIRENTGVGGAIGYFKLDYDVVGRVKTEFVAPLPQNVTESSFTVVHDADNRISTFNGATVTHDSDGNMISGPLNAAAAVSHSYDARNRLTAVAAQGTAPALSYGYDSEGNRISVTQAGQTTRYAVNPVGALSQVLVRTKPNGSKTYYVYGFGLLYEVDEGENVSTYHYDYRGSTVAITDTTGAVTDRVEYSVYGRLTYRTGTTDTPFLYNGRYGVMTDANGLMNMRARYYNPHIRRFLNADPSGFSGGMNWYAYADGNPISLIDPFGLHGNPVSGPEGPVGPSSPFTSGGVFYSRSPNQATPIDYFVGGTVFGAVVATAVVLAPPVAVSGLVSAGISETAAAGTVTLLLYAAGGYGAYRTVETTAQNVGAATVTDNWNPVAFNAGTIVGGGLVGVRGGGRALAEGIMGQKSAAPNTWNPLSILDYEIANAYNSSLGAPGLNYWATAPTPFSGGFTAGSIASGAGTSMQTSGSPEQLSNGSWINPWAAPSPPNGK